MKKAEIPCVMAIRVALKVLFLSLLLDDRCINRYVDAFSVVIPINTRHPKSFTTFSSLRASSTVVDDAAKLKLIETSKQLKDEYGIFLFEKSAKERLKESLDIFESYNNKNNFMTSSESSMIDLLLGDWELVCTTSASNDGIEIPSFVNQGPLKTIRDSIRNTANKYLSVEQRIMSSNDNNVIDRIDHVIEYDPPSELKDVLQSLPEQLTSFNINPLQVSSSKLILVHKASIVESSVPIQIKLSLNKIVLNVAGTSTILDPSGKDIAAFNLPLGDLMNVGEFITTYVDDTIRVSRGKRTNNLLQDDQIRVFLRKGRSRPFRADTPSMDVDDAIDPEFDSDIESPSDVE